MPRLIWIPAALRDVQRLYRFLLPSSPETLRRAASVIRTGMQVVALQPGIGRPFADIAREYREWLIDFWSRSYVVQLEFSRSA